MLPPEEQQSLPRSEPVAPGYVPPPPVIEAKLVPMTAQRPAAVLVIAILFLVGSLFELVGLIQQSPSPVLNMINRVDSVVFCVALALVGIGLLQLREVARVAAICVMVARFVIMAALVYPAMQTLPPNLPNEQIVRITMTVTFVLIFAFYLVYFGVLIYFLTRPAVKEAFHR